MSLVSIIIPTYNSARTLEQCLISIQNQDYTNIEIIVVDNNRSEQELVNITINRVSKTVRRFINTPIKSYIAKRWMAKERIARRKDV